MKSLADDVGREVLMLKVPEFYVETIWKSVHAVYCLRERTFYSAGER